MKTNLYKVFSELIRPTTQVSGMRSLSLLFTLENNVGKFHVICAWLPNHIRHTRGEFDHTRHECEEYGHIHQTCEKSDHILHTYEECVHINHTCGRCDELAFAAKQHDAMHIVKGNFYNHCTNMKHL